jgi:signal transduction histidine kinase
VAGSVVQPDESREVSVEVLLAGLTAVLTLGVVVLVGTRGSHPPHVVHLGATAAVAVVGGLVLDQRPGSGAGRGLVAIPVLALLILGAAAALARGWPGQAELATAQSALAGGLLAVAALALPRVTAPHVGARTAYLTFSVAAVLGGSTVAALTLLGVKAGQVTLGWVLLALGVVGAWSIVLRETFSRGHSPRQEQRRTVWLLVVMALAGAVLLGSWGVLPDSVAEYLSAGAVVLFAVSTLRIVLASDFRPLGEPAFDIGIGVAVVMGAALVAVLVWAGASWAGLPSPSTAAAFTALTTVGAGIPAALWARRSFVARRYGSGTLTPADVAVITADLHAQTDPRELLNKAARMVAAASSTPSARIILGEDDPVAPPNWLIVPLVVGGERVGALVVAAEDPEGHEGRQLRAIRQLVPTVALVARAVGLAVEANHARQDVARERDTERGRILADLHDGLGPVLSGMSMRVQAGLRHAPPGPQHDLLAALAADLAASRADLRRLVAGLTPSALREGNLESALDGLVASFAGVPDGPLVSLQRPGGLSALVPDVKVTIYRSVAEGITNALRHAAAETIDVRVSWADGVMHVDVSDDGIGGPVVPGVGLTSLARRAEGVGGSLRILSDHGRGTRLHLELPATEEVSA